MTTPDAPEDPLDESPPEEHDVLIRLPLSNRQMGTQQERLDLEALGDRLEALVTELGVGEYDGDEIGAGECTLFFCGPDADRLLAVLVPEIRKAGYVRGVKATVQRGDADPETKNL